MTRFLVTVTTEVDDAGERFRVAEQLKDEIAKVVILNRLAFADKMEVRVDAVPSAESEQPQE